MRLLRVILFTALTAIFLSGCGNSQADNQRPVVIVTLPPHQALLQAITGDSIEVVTLLKADADAESTEFSVKDMRRIADADLYIAAGHLPFETNFIKKISEENPNLKIARADKDVELIYGTHSHDGESHTIADPHTWFSVKNMRRIAANMLAELRAIDPDNSDYYVANHRRLDSRLDSLDRVIRHRLSNADRHSFIVWHPSLSYFARDYGLKQLAIGAENKETTVRMMQERLRDAGKSGIKSFFIQSGIDSRQAENVARELQLKPVAVNTQEADWENQINVVVDELTR